MTLSHASRNNSSFPRARRSTIVAVNNKLAHARQNIPETERHTNLRRLIELVADLKRALANHAEGIDNFNAVVVFEYAVAVAVQGIRIAEEGSREFPYASDVESGQQDLFKQKE